MSIEGIIRYRLLGDHPAASGRHLQLSFPGEVLSVSQVLQQLVQEHLIDESLYKLEVVQLNVNANVTPTPLTQDVELHNYSRIEVRVSTRNFKEEAQQQQTDSPCKVREVNETLENSLLKAHPRTLERRPAPASGRDDMLYQRATAIAAQSHLPLRPGSRYTADEKPTKCELCSLSLFSPVLLPCCGFTVCSSCKDSAETMMPSAHVCVICGHSSGPSPEPSKSDWKAAPIQRSLKKETFVEEAPHETRMPMSSAQEPPKREETEMGFGISFSEEVVEQFSETLRAFLDRSLSLLDAPDPLPAVCRDKRRRGEVLGELDRLAKQSKKDRRYFSLYG